MFFPNGVGRTAYATGSSGHLFLFGSLEVVWGTFPHSSPLVAKSSPNKGHKVREFEACVDTLLGSFVEALTPKCGLACHSLWVRDGVQRPPSGHVRG